MFQFLFVFLVIGSCYCQPNRCRNGSKYWCQTIETATECGVLEYCKLHQLGGFQHKDQAKIQRTAQAVKIERNAQPVKIELYYESFCGGCQLFIKEQLWPTYNILKSSGIMEIGLYPYGNAYERRVGDRWQFDCQHGKEECEINLIETCALHMLTEPSDYLPFIHCVESSPSTENAKACAQKLKVNWETLSNCTTGPLGNQLEHEMAVKTNALSPRHTYVPWIVVNNVHTEGTQTDAQVDLLNFVCRTYKGSKPKACQREERQRCFKWNVV